MNFQSIFFVLSIFAHFTFGYSKISTGGRLSPEENQQRLDTCGREGLPNPPNQSKPPSWFWVSYQTSPDNNTVFTSASQISSRHFLTFSTNLLNGDKTWIHNNSKFDVNCTDEANLNMEVPTEVLNLLKLTPLSCYRNPNCDDPVVTPVRAFILHYCDSYIQEHFFITYSPMIVEVQENILGNPVCLDKKKSSIRNGDTVESYRLLTNLTLKQSKLNVKNYRHAIFIRTTTIAPRQSFSGPIVKLFANKWTIVGYVSTSITLENRTQQAFFRMSLFRESVCSLTGICEGKLTKTTIPVRTIATAPPIEATVPVTTAKLTTVTIAPTVPTTAKSVTTQPQKVLTTVTTTTSSTKPPTPVQVTPPPVKPTVARATVQPTTVTTKSITTTTTKPVTPQPPGSPTMVTSLTKLFTVPKTLPPVTKTAPTTTVQLTTVTHTLKPSTMKPLNTVATTTIGETTSQVTIPTTPEVVTDPDGMTVSTSQPQNSTEETTPETTQPSDPLPEDSITYEPPLPLEIGFSLGPEPTEPWIDYEEYEKRKEHMDDDDYKDFWMDEQNGGRKLKFLLVLVIIFWV